MNKYMTKEARELRGALPEDAHLFYAYPVHVALKANDHNGASRKKGHRRRLGWPYNYRRYGYAYGQGDLAYRKECMAPMEWPNRRNKGIPSRLRWNHQNGHCYNGRKKWPDYSSEIRNKGVENRADLAGGMLAPGSRMMAPCCDWRRRKP